MPTSISALIALKTTRHTQAKDRKIEMHTMPLGRDAGRILTMWPTQVCIHHPSMPSCQDICLYLEAYAWDVPRESLDDANAIVNISQ